MSTATEFLREIEAEAKARGIAPSTLCQRAVKNSKLPSRLSAGGTVTLKSIADIRQWVNDNPAPENVTQNVTFTPQNLTIAAANPSLGSDGDAPAVTEARSGRPAFPACSPVGTRHRSTLDPVASAVASPRQQDT